MSQTTTLVVRKQSPSKAEKTSLVLKMNIQPVLQSRWYFGGLASAGACCCMYQKLCVYNFFY